MTEMKVTRIPAKRRGYGRTSTEKEKKIRVAAYCRVSTDNEEQESSYDVQIRHFKEYIGRKKEWTLAGTYADDGISGTNMKKRDQFNQMIADAMNGKIDLILTKSISRFARNTLDCLNVVRKLKEKKIPVYFEKENINTMDSSGELLLTIMSSIAQQESESLSRNVKIGLQYRFQQGKISVNHTRFLGYTKDKKGDLVIVPEEAKVVKRIFREYLEGKSFINIASGLEADGILTGAHRKKWYDNTIRKILKNEKYTGDALLQKTYTVDFLQKKRAVNDGSVPQYYVENSHEAIIPKQIFNEVQVEMARRSSLRDSDGRRIGYSGKYALSGIVFCGKCGSPYRRVSWNPRGKKKVVVWKCRERAMDGPDACDGRCVHEEVLQDAIVQAIHMMLCDPEKEYDAVAEDILEEERMDHAEEELTGIDEKLEDLQKAVLQKIYDSDEYDKLVDEIEGLRDRKVEIEEKKALESENEEKIARIREYLKDKKTDILGYSDQLTRDFVEKITVLPETVRVEMKNGAVKEIKV